MAALAWIVATTIAFALGGFAFHLPGSFGGLREWDPVATIFGVMIGTANGIGVGLLQWAALRLPRAQGVRLVLAMGLAIGITHGVDDGAPDSLGLIVVAATSGIVVALVFAGVLGVRSPMAMLASAGGWAGGMWLAAWFVPRLGMPFHETPVDWSLTHLVAGIVIAIAWTIPTALVGLPDALRREQRTPEVTLTPATT